MNPLYGMGCACGLGVQVLLEENQKHFGVRGCAREAATPAY
jgi:hypothetical protein